MKRRYSDGRRNRIERDYVKFAQGRNKNLRWLLEGRDRNIGALENRIQKLEKQKEELTKAVFNTSIAVRLGRLLTPERDSNVLVTHTEQFEVRATFSFNSASFPMCLVDEIPALVSVAHVIQRVLVDKINALNTAIPTKACNPPEFQREYACEFTDGKERK